MVLRLLPREEIFFELFNQSAQNILQGARLLRELLDDYRHIEERAATLKAVEERGDDLTHQIIDRLNRTFVAPLDHEDIIELAKQLDNVLDWIEAGAARMVIYRIAHPTREAQELAHIIVSISEAIVDGVANLQRLDRIDPVVQEINRLENLADRVHRDVIAKLFADHGDPIEVIKWKEIYETLEEATDQGEDVANVLDTIRSKKM
jgi:hypothetical protein